MSEFYLKKIFDGYVQIYRIMNPTQKIKKLLDAKFTYIYKDGVNVVVNKSDKLQPEIIFNMTNGYVFTYAAKIPILYKEERNKSIVYVNLNGESPIVLKLSPCFNVSPFHIHDYIFNFDVDIDLKQVAKYIKDDLIENKFNSLDEFIKRILILCPLDHYGMSYNYPEIIKKSNLNNEIKVNINDFNIFYDLNAKNNNEEISLIKKIENLFYDTDDIITFYNTYNNILEIIVERFDKDKIEYEIVKNNEIKGIFAIKTKLKNITNLDIEYNLTDIL